MAIKGFSLARHPQNVTTNSGAKSAARPRPTSALGKRSRGAFGSTHDDGNGPDDGERDSDPGRAIEEEVTGFGEEGAVGKVQRASKEPLVIPNLGDGAWKRRRGQKNLLPAEVQAQQQAASEAQRATNGSSRSRVDGVDVVNGADAEIKWGLTVSTKQTLVKGPAEDEKDTAVERSNNPNLAPQAPERSVEELALAALTGDQTSIPRSTLVIPVNGMEARSKVNEADAYRAAMAAAPDVSTLEDYERVPVEEFGAALLRGMGWNGEVVKGAREAKRRQNLLGLGAKELKDAEELGAWVQKSDVKRLDTRGERRDRRGEGSKMEEYRRERDRRRERRDREDDDGDRRDRNSDRRHGDRAERRDYRRDADRDGRRDHRRDHNEVRPVGAGRDIYGNGHRNQNRQRDEYYR